MQKKIVVAIIIAILLITGAVFLNKAKNKDSQKMDAQTQLKNDTDLSAAANDQQSDVNKIVPTTMSTRVASGPVTKIGGNNISVKSANGTMDIKVAEGTFFYSMDGGKQGDKKLEDIKVGSVITFEYNEATNEALSVRIDQ